MEQVAATITSDDLAKIELIPAVSLKEAVEACSFWAWRIRAREAAAVNDGLISEARLDYLRHAKGLSMMATTGRFMLLNEAEARKMLDDLRRLYGD